jgi:hypothetical protein
VQVNKGADLPFAKRGLLMAQNRIQCFANRPADGRSEPHQEAHNWRRHAANSEAIAGAHSLRKNLACRTTNENGEEKRLCE